MLNSSLHSNQNDEITHLDSLCIFNQLYLKQSHSKDNHYIFIVGKMFKHSTMAEYSFKACNFHLYDPSSNCLYHSSMVSDVCFTKTLKWTPKFYKKIRNCLASSSTKDNKNFYFTLIEKNKSDDELINVKQKFLELHCIIDKDDIAVFRMLLDSIVENEPYIFIMNKALELDKEEQDSVKQKQDRYYEKEKDIEKNEEEIEKIELEFENKKDEYIVKFYLINKEKNSKKKELENEINNKHLN